MITRNLLSLKLEGQHRISKESLASPAAAGEIETSLEALARVDSIDAALKLEAKAASAYWGAWRDVS